MTGALRGEELWAGTSNSWRATVDRDKLHPRAAGGHAELSGIGGSSFFCFPPYVQFHESIPLDSREEHYDFGIWQRSVECVAERSGGRVSKEVHSQ